MSEKITVIIGNHIKELRESQQMSQQDLADKMHKSRPVISNWENGKNEPSSSQLVKLAKILGVSIDTIVGNNSEPRKIIVIDTSALIKRPSIIDELVDKFDEVIVPEIVISELNNLKDRGKPSVKQKAWLVMANIQNIKERIIIEPSIEKEGKNDEKIIAIAQRKAKSSPIDTIYMFSNDIWFSFLANGQNNLQTITNEQYAELFTYSNKDFDHLQSIEFCSLVKNRKIEEVKKLDLHAVDINKTSPEDGMTPLIHAVRNRDFNMVKHLVSLPDIKLDIHDKHKYGFTALHHSTQMKNLNLMKLLVEAGADTDVGSIGKNSGNTCLMVAAWSGFKQGVEYLLTQGSCTNQQDSNGFTPLIKACIQHQYEIVKLLINKTDHNIRSRENRKGMEYIKPSKQNSNKIITLFKEMKNA